MSPVTHTEVIVKAALFCGGRVAGSSVRAAVAACVLAVTLAGCAQQPQRLATSTHGSEYFPSSVYGAASRRVIADGQPIPHGGGQYLVGKPYTVAGQTYYPSERRITQVGYASWYGDAFHGRLTANGEIYDRDGFTAAHPTMPLPSYARVTNLRNNASMIVRVNDRGPYASNRIMDVSRRVAEALDFKRYGTAPIRVEYVGPASLAGSDDARLYATLRTNGPARWQDGDRATMVAETAPRARVASLAPYTPASRIERHIEDQRPEALAPFRAPFRASREASSRSSPVRPDAANRAPRKSFGETAVAARPTESSHHRTDFARAESDRPIRLASREAAPRDRATARLVEADVRPPRRPQDRAKPKRETAEPKTHASTRLAMMLPPSRPSDLGSAKSAVRGSSQHKSIGLRTERSQRD